MKLHGKIIFLSFIALIVLISLAIALNYNEGKYGAVGTKYEGAIPSETKNSFIRGDANMDGLTDISDPIVILNYLFKGSITIKCLDAADANDSGQVDVSDVIYLLNYLFRENSQGIPPPFELAGFDNTEDELDCLG